MTTTTSSAAVDSDLLDQTQYLASRIYDDPGAEPISLDLFSACAIGNYECVQDAINSGLDLNSRNKAGWTPLMYAAYVGHDTVVNLLLDSDANPSLGTPGNLTPLMVAAGCGNESVCYFLIQSDAEIDAQDSNGFTALLYAVRQGHNTVVQLLLEAGADLSLTEKEKNSTALMLAAIEGDEIIVDILVACGADLNAKDRDGHTARSLAFNKHHVRTVTLLDNASFMFRRMSGSTGTLEPPSFEDEEREKEIAVDNEEAGFEGSGDLFSGAKEFESYKQAQAVKKKIQFNLGMRSGSRWSLPQQYLGRRASGGVVLGLGSDSGDFLGLKQKRLRPAISMPERANPPQIEEEEEEVELSVDEKLVELLRQLDLDKYIDVFHQQEIDFESFLTFNDEDLKRIGIKLMGPRRKLSLAITEVRKQREDVEGEGGGGQREVAEKERHSESDDRESADSGRVERQSSRPQLMKQPSTELTAAYRHAVETIEYLEKQLTQEHQLRKAADSYLLKLQTARQHIVGCMDSVKDTQRSINKHCKAVRSTHGKISSEMETLRLLTTSTIVDPKQLHKIYSEVVSLCAKMGLELEALSRSVVSANEHTETLAYHLDSNS